MIEVELLKAQAEAAYWKAECEALLAQARGGEPQRLEIIHLQWPEDDLDKGGSDAR